MAPQITRFDDWLSGYFLTKQAEGISPNTILNYRTTFKHLAKWCDQEVKPDLTTLTATDLRKFLTSQRQQPNRTGGTLSPKTIRNRWIALRSFYRWLAKEMSQPNPMLSVPCPKATTRIVHPLRRDEIAAVLTACDYTAIAKTVKRVEFRMARETALRDRVLILVMLDAGLRVGEMCALTVADIDVSTGRINEKNARGARAA